ncbi:MAG: copper amine oxidase N-terminal domain-containing protein [Caldisericia bacterium]
MDCGNQNCGNEADETRIELTIDDSIAVVKFEPLPLMVISITIIYGTTMVPLRFVAEAFEAEIIWNGDDRSILIKKEVAPIPDFKTQKVKNTDNLILDDWNPSVLEAEHYMIEGEVPAGSSVFVNEKEAEIFKKFRITMSRQPPSITPINIESEDPEGEPIIFKTERFVNAGELLIKLWVDKTEMMVNGTPDELYDPHK